MSLCEKIIFSYDKLEIQLHEKHMVDGEEKNYVLEFDFLGKDSMRYHNFVSVTKVFFKKYKQTFANKR